jgi:hypothetical protein
MDSMLLVIMKINAILYHIPSDYLPRPFNLVSQSFGWDLDSGTGPQICTVIWDGEDGKKRSSPGVEEDGDGIHLMRQDNFG